MVSLARLSGDSMAPTALEAKKIMAKRGRTGKTQSGAAAPAGPPAPFWRVKGLAAMTPEEWESLCDGCGRCCTVLLRDEDTGALYETDVGCRLFDAKARRCTDYARRHQRVRDCVKLTPESVGALDFLPPTCAYRLVAAGEDLPHWHHLICGDRDAVRRAGAAAAPDLINERDVAVEDLEDHVTLERGRGDR